MAMVSGGVVRAILDRWLSPEMGAGYQAVF